MTIADYSKNEKRGFFSIYKPGQGMYVRWGTVAFASLIVFTGAAWIGYKVLAVQDIEIKAAGIAIWVAIFAVLIFWLVNTPRLAEFMIMTESEMRKVTWPSRRQVINSTKIVILLTILLGVLLWMVDAGFKTLFEWIKIL